MSVNYAIKYSAEIDEKFKLGSLTGSAVNNNYDFIGVSTVKVYSIPTVSLTNYSLSGASRYGSPSELDNNVQELTLGQDRAFTFTIDRKGYDDGMGVMDAGKALAREIDEVIIPEIDSYRIAKIADNAANFAVYAITNSNAYEKFLDGMEKLSDAKVPLVGRVAFVSNAFYKAIKRDSSFVKASDMGMDIAIKGVIGMVDGCPLVAVPASMMPKGADFVITHKDACVAPVKLQEYKIHDNAPGISGWLVEGRVRYDAFILNNKACACYVHGHSAFTSATATYDISDATAITLTLNDGEVESAIWEDETTALTPSTDWTQSGTTVTLKPAAFTGISASVTPYNLIFKLKNGLKLTAAITVQA